MFYSLSSINVHNYCLQALIKQKLIQKSITQNLVICCDLVLNGLLCISCTNLCVYKEQDTWDREGLSEDSAHSCCWCDKKGTNFLVEHSLHFTDSTERWWYRYHSADFFPSAVHFYLVVAEDMVWHTSECAQAENTVPLFLCMPHHATFMGKASTVYIVWSLCNNEWKACRIMEKVISEAVFRGCKGFSRGLYVT